MSKRDRLWLSGGIALTLTMGVIWAGGGSAPNWLRGMAAGSFCWVFITWLPAPRRR